MSSRPSPTAAERDVYAALVALRARGVPSVLATVVRTTGSTPRKAGARMLVSGAETEPPVGTIGGGRVELEVVEACRALLGARAPGPQLLRLHLTHDLAMCCGGEMEVFVEPILPAPPLVVCGGGHVARALVPMARAVGFSPIVVDEATEGGEEFATPERFPDAERLVDSWDPRDWGLPLDERLWAVIVTRDHAVDARLLERLIGQDLAYLGLIGSKRKIAMFRQRLEARGVEPSRFERLHAPIGLDIGAQTPEEIAVAIVAELVQVRAAGRRQR